MGAPRSEAGLCATVGWLERQGSTPASPRDQPAPRPLVTPSTVTHRSSGHQSPTPSLSTTASQQPSSPVTTTTNNIPHHHSTTNTLFSLLTRLHHTSTVTSQPLSPRSSFCREKISLHHARDGFCPFCPRPQLHSVSQPSFKLELAHLAVILPLRQDAPNLSGV